MRSLSVKKIISAILMIGLFFMQANAAAPFAGYEYSTDNYNGLIVSKRDIANAKPAPAAFVFDDALNSGRLNLDVPLNAPEDFVCDDNGNVYILDTLNGRIVIVDKSLSKTLCIIRGWMPGGAENTRFTGGRGIYQVDGRLYVSLTQDKKIVSFVIPLFIRNSSEFEPEDGVELVSGEHGKPLVIDVTADRIVESPDLSAIRDTFDFKPTKLAADSAGRLYVVVEGIFDGLMMIDSSNAFTGFVGANRIKISAIDLLWRRLSTDAQIEAQEDTVPIEFNSLDMDEEGFLYTTSKGNENENLVRRLNLIGNDVLKQGTWFIKGELSALVRQGVPGSTSHLIDIDVTEGGIYTCLDNIRGKLFTYNSEGDLLFAFGGISAQRGAFRVPAAVKWNNGKILVLDKGNNELVIFRPTEYGQAVIAATHTQYTGGYGESWDQWNKVLILNPHNQAANRNVGKLQYDKGEYYKAMQHFRLGNSPELYSQAYAKYRKIKAEKVIPWIAGGLILAFAVWVILKTVRFVRQSHERWVFFKEEARKYKERNSRK